METDIETYLNNYNSEIITLYLDIRQIIYENHENVIEKMWAKLPSYYVEDNVIRLIPFKDHINIEATAILNNKKDLTLYKITPKGMLQIFVNQKLPIKILEKIFRETLNK